MGQILVCTAPKPAEFFLLVSSLFRPTNRGRLNIYCPGDHVDILGRSSLNDLILRVAGGKGEQIEENYVSNIREYAENVKIYEEKEWCGDK